MKTPASIPVRMLRTFAQKFREGLDKLPRHFLISGASINCQGVTLRFPKDVGISYSTNLFWWGDRGYEPTTTRVLMALMPRARHFIDSRLEHWFLFRSCSEAVSVAAS